VCGDLKLDRRDVFMLLARLEAHGLVQVVEKSLQKKRRGRERREKRGVERIERILVSPACIASFLQAHEVFGVGRVELHATPGSTIVVA